MRGLNRLLSVLVLSLSLLLAAFPALASEDFRLAVTQQSITPASSLSQPVQEEFGTTSRVVDWNDLKSAYQTDPDGIRKFISTLHGRVLLTRDGKEDTSTGRYFIQIGKGADGLSFTLHDQLGDTPLYLGSALLGDFPVLAILPPKDERALILLEQERTPLRNFRQLYISSNCLSPSDLPYKAIKAEFGSGARIADWDELQNVEMGDPDATFRLLGLGRDWKALVTRNGNRLSQNGLLWAVTNPPQRTSGGAWGDNLHITEVGEECLPALVVVPETRIKEEVPDKERIYPLMAGGRFNWFYQLSADGILRGLGKNYGAQLGQGWVVAKTSSGHVEYDWNKGPFHSPVVIDRDIVTFLDWNNVFDGQISYLKKDGTVWWLPNQVDGKQNPMPVKADIPVPVADIGRFRNTFLFALGRDGSIWRNDIWSGTSPITKEGKKHEYIRIPAPAGITQLASTDGGPAVLTKDGQIWVLFTADTFRWTPVKGMSKMKRLITAGASVFGVDEKGDTYGCTTGSGLGLGNADPNPPRCVPEYGVNAPDIAVNIPELKGIQLAAASPNYIAFTKDDGSLWSWGNGRDESHVGRVVYFPLGSKPYPQPVPSAVKFAAMYYSVALFLIGQDGHVYSMDGPDPGETIETHNRARSMPFGSGVGVVPIPLWQAMEVGVLTPEPVPLLDKLSQGIWEPQAAPTEKQPKKVVNSTTRKTKAPQKAKPVQKSESWLDKLRNYMPK